MLSLNSLSLDYMWENVRCGSPDECWEWLGERHKSGHGRLKVVNHIGKEVYLQAHRVIWGLVHGRKGIKKKTLHHECENPPCCNLRHLRPMMKVEHVDLHRPKEGESE
ncbi:hypothetical protein LCGC14_2466790 [marine sediment metagenome]|uniref:HNH nuclease domain-containing protein n=1 Tax=marine sediment metagenome TaxID=412755 RepID=A0A0F9BZC2_9ZZZZ